MTSGTYVHVCSYSAVLSVIVFLLYTDRLDAPMAPPQLQRISQNVYSLDLPTDSEMGMFSTASPVFSIQTESNQQYYQWMVDVELTHLCYL